MKYILSEHKNVGLAQTLSSEQAKERALTSTICTDQQATSTAFQHQITSF